MMKKLNIAILCCLLAVLAGCASRGTSLKESASIKKVAVVSFSVSDVGGSVRAGSIGSTPVSILIDNAVNDMLADTEKKLGNKWTVVKASGFSTNAGYRKQSVEKTLTVYVPKHKGKEMAVFTQVSKEIKGGIIASERAKALCSALEVDAVVVVFSEWTAKTGGMVPTTKALTKNIFTIWDRQGNMVAKRRVDTMGKKTLGFAGFKAVNNETIEQWRDAFNTALDKIISSI